MKGSLFTRVAILALASLFIASVAVGATFEGSTSGIFTNAEGPATMVTAGEGTNDFSWGEAYPTVSELEFNGTGFAAEADTVFSFGTLYYYNGTIIADTGADSVDLYVTAVLTSPLGTTESFTFPFELINTVNTSDPYDSADYVNFAAVADPASFSYDGTDYTLQFLGFGEIAGGGYSLVDQFHVYESEGARASLLGRFTAKENLVPEPSTRLLLGGGLLGLVGYGRKRLKK